MKLDTMLFVDVFQQFRGLLLISMNWILLTVGLCRNTHGKQL